MNKEEKRDICGTCPDCNGRWFRIENDSYICNTCNKTIGINLNFENIPEYQLKQIFNHIKLFREIFGNSAYHYELHTNQCKICQIYIDSAI